MNAALPIYPFPRKNRLLTPADYSPVFKEGRKQRGASFTFIFRVNGLSYPRLGLAIAKKNIPLAVGRNKVRRLIRERFRHLQSHLGGIDIVVLTQKPLQDLGKTYLREELEQRWQGIISFVNRSC